MSTPWAELPQEVRDIFLYGTRGERLYVTYVNRAGLKRSYMTIFEGIVPNLERRYRETDSDYMRAKIEEYMADRPCPACEGARLKPSTLAVRIGGLNIYELSLLPVTGAIKFLDELELTASGSGSSAARVLKEIRERLDLPGLGGRGLPQPAP